VYEKTSGAGGFSLKAESDIPIVRDLNNGEALFDLGFSDPDAEVLASSRVFGYRLLPGEDVSCRNLYQPGRPRILGVPEAQIERGGFRFQSLIHESDQPWSLLKEELGPGVIPAFGDMNSVMWILHKSLGDELTLIDGNGEEVRLRLVGLLSRSIFQSELLISGANFEKHFPVQSGFSYFLIDAPPQVAGEISGVLEDNLSRWGFDATSTKNVLAGFLAIENTYLSTFQTLGGLGLLLGTLGLAIVVIRNTIERRGELATLQAFGFPRKKISGLVLTENCYLLLLGIILGTVSALLAVMPHLLQNSEGVHWGSLLLTLVAVFVVGALASGISVSGVLKKPLIPTLRGE
jgi:hypothetical protein